MHLSPEQLKRLSPGPNQVLLSINMFNDKIRVANNELIIDTTFNPEDHITVTGTVVAVPDRLIFSHDRSVYRSMEWETDIEIQIGDRVYLEYLQVLLALGTKASAAAPYPEPKWFAVGNDVFIFVEYSALYFALRGDRIVMLNGFIMIEPIEVDKVDQRRANAAGIILLDNKTPTMWAKVLHAGSRVTDHKEKKKRPTGKVKQGDIIMYKPFARVKVENTLHQTLMKGKKYFVVQQWYAIGIIDASIAQDMEHKIKNGLMKAL